MELKEFTKIYEKIKRWYPENSYLKPFPVLIAISLIFIGIYSITYLNPELYDLLEQSSTNPFSYFTSLLIHDLDNLSHLSINIFALWIFGYIISIQTSHIRMVFIFILCGVLANISVEIFGNLLNSIVTPTFIAWATSSGYYVKEGLRVIPSPSGGGASDGLTGLVGFSIALAVNYFGISIYEAYQSGNSVQEGIINLKNSLIDSSGMTIVHIVAILGISVLYAALQVDLEMFYFILTHNYAGANGTFLSFPTSGGHPLLAHVFGGLIGFIMGLFYVKYNFCRLEQ